MLLHFPPEARPKHTTPYVPVQLHIASHVNIGDMQLYLVHFVQHVRSSICVSGSNCILTCVYFLMQLYIMQLKVATWMWWPSWS